MSPEPPDDWNEIKSPTVEQAETLSGCSDNELYLNGLIAIDAAAASALAMLQGLELHLGGLTKLDADTAEALAHFRDRVELLGLTSLSKEAAETLRANPKIVLPGKFKR